MNEELCVHFGTCGGCLFQDMGRESYAALKLRSVRDALDSQGLTEARIDTIVHVAPQTRRRAVLKAGLDGGVVRLGFYAAKSHDIVDMTECRLMTPALVRLLNPLREFLKDVVSAEAISVHLTESATGIDMALDGVIESLDALRAGAASFAAKNNIARILFKNDVVTETAAPSIRIGDVILRLPPRVFLQPTQEGEEMLWKNVQAILKPAKKVADLFAGAGTFSLRLAARASVLAVDSSAAMIDALAVAARGTKGLKPVTTSVRDLFKRPLQPFELSAFDAVLLDPPRAGAAEQVKQISASTLASIAYVSCNAQSFARDAAELVKAGYRMSDVKIVDQFLWSDHIEMVVGFTKPAKRKFR